VSYGYDADGRRVTSTLGANTRQFVWDELSTYGDVIAELDGSGALLTSYVLGGGQIVSQTQAGNSSYYHPDVLGSTRALSDSSGSVTDTYSYNAYGQIVSQTGSTANSWLCYLGMNAC